MLTPDRYGSMWPATAYRGGVASCQLTRKEFGVLDIC